MRVYRVWFQTQSMSVDSEAIFLKTKVRSITVIHCI